MLGDEYTRCLKKMQALKKKTPLKLRLFFALWLLPFSKVAKISPRLIPRRKKLSRPLKLYLKKCASKIDSNL